jgi:hypothetical protein
MRDNTLKVSEFDSDSPQKASSILESNKEIYQLKKLSSNNVLIENENNYQAEDASNTENMTKFNKITDNKNIINNPSIQLNINIQVNNSHRGSQISKIEYNKSSKEVDVNVRNLVDNIFANIPSFGNDKGFSSDGEGKRESVLCRHINEKDLSKTVSKNYNRAKSIQESDENERKLHQPSLFIENPCKNKKD